MKKSNSKQLYRLAKRLKAKQNIALDDSLDAPALPPKKKTTHIRSQSCPFDGVEFHHQRSALQEKQYNDSTLSHKKKDSYQSSASQASISKTMIVRDVPDFSKTQKFSKGRRELLKKSVIGLKSQGFSRIRLEHQMRAYELKKELNSIQKECENSSIKQRILDTFLRPQTDLFEHSFQFA